MLRKWKDKERWTGRRRSEPCGAGEEEEEEEERQTDRRDRQTHRFMLRRKSEPCGQMEEDEKTEEEEKKSKSGRKKERRRSESSVEEEFRQDRRRAERGRGKDRRNSASWISVEDRPGGQTDRRPREADSRTLRRRSEPCGILYVQMLPLSNRKRRELLQRRTGRRTSCSEEGDGQTERRQRDQFRQMTRGRSEPIGPLDNSKHNDYTNTTVSHSQLVTYSLGAWTRHLGVAF